nr:putative reverse transcriptase domain-containing protein [Tanacetum cinerariifolium]
MAPRVMTRSAARRVAESQGEGTGVRVGRCGRGRRHREGNDERVDDWNGQKMKGLKTNGGVEGVNRKVGYSYKEFLACNPKEYDGKRGVVVLTRWIKKMENVQDMSGCSVDQKVKYTAGSFVETELWNHVMVEASHAAYTDRFHELARLVPHLVTPESRMIERYVYGLAPQICGMVAAMEPKSIQKDDKKGRDDNKRTRTRNVFAFIENPVGRENTSTWPKCTTCNSYYAPEGPCRTCFNCNRPSHLAKDCRGVPRNVNHVNVGNPPVRACYECGSTSHVRSACPRLNRTQGPGGNYQNQVVANNVGQGRGNQENQARGRAYMLGTEEAHQDPNIMTGIEPSELGFRYEIKIASRQLVKIDRVVRIPLPDGKVLRVLGERLEEKVRLLMSPKASDKNQGEIVVVIDFLERSFRVNSRNSKTKVSFVQVHRLGEHRILAAQKEAVDESGEVRTLIMDEAYKSKYSIHPGADKMYYDLRDRYWWLGMKNDIANYKGIAMDFVTKLPRTSSGHDTIWVTVDRLTKSAHFLPMREDYKMDRLARFYLNEIVARHGTRLDISMAYHPQTNGHSERTIQTLEYMLRACVLDFRGSWDVHLLLVEFSYNNSYYFSVRCASFEALYGRKCRLPIMWANDGEGQLIGTELVPETTEKISQIKDRLKAVHDRQKSYADKRRKHLEFSIGDNVLLKVSPWKGVVRFGKKGDLAPIFVGPFKFIEKVGPVAYRLFLPEELNGVHDTFYVSNLKKCLLI